MTTRTISTQKSKQPSMQLKEAAESTALKTLQAVNHITQWDELPEWMKLDPYINSGYRRQLNSFEGCFRSLFYRHNELVNTWSHLIPGLCSLGLLVQADYSAHHSGANISFGDKLVVQLYLAGTAGCLLLSAFYHGTNAHSEKVSHDCLKLDYLGIVLSISVSSISSTYFGLYGEGQLQGIYILLCCFFALAVFINLLGPGADGPKAANWRVAILMALFSTGFVPILHKLATHGFAGVQNFPLRHTAMTTTCYLIGTAFYVTHFPEKYILNTFDIWGASHQLFHIMVAIGQTVFLLGLRELMLKQHLGQT